MDQRLTLKTNEKFDEMLQQLLQQEEPVRVLYDDNGIERANGMIGKIELTGEKRFVILTTGQKILIDSIIGVNGIFKDDYTEC